MMNYLTIILISRAVCCWLWMVFKSHKLALALDCEPELLLDS